MNAEWKIVGSIGDSQEGNDTGLVTFTLNYSLPKDWWSDLIGGNAVDRMKGKEIRPELPMANDSALSEIPSEPPSRYSPTATSGISHQERTAPIRIEEIPWESN